MMSTLLATMDFEAQRAWLAPVLTREIPLGGAMGLAISRLDRAGIGLTAPLAPNVNDKCTAFGGALVSLMLLAGWSLPRLLMRGHSLRGDLVIGRCEVRFSTPVRDALCAECDWPDAAACDAFTNRLRRGERARLVLTPRIVVGGEVAASLLARYAALPETGAGART